MELPHRRAELVSKGVTARGLLRVARHERRRRALDDILWVLTGRNQLPLENRGVNWGSGEIWRR